MNFPLKLSKKNYFSSMDWLSGLSFSNPKIVLEKGKPGAWDEFGVRDPALLTGETGTLVKENGALVMYYTASANGIQQGVGRAISHDDGLNWIKEPAHPVLEPQKGSWDYPMASTAWVIKDNNNVYRMFYQGGASETGTAAVGLAKSKDGINFNRVGPDPVLTAHDFLGLKKPPFAAMGVLNIARTLTGQYLLTFEGLSIKHYGLGQIFGAISDDLENFKPFNNGEPIFSCDDVTSWPIKRACNPRITTLENQNMYILSFNGHFESGMYSIGLAFSEDLKTWKEHPGNPLLCPTGTPINNPFSGRIEGGVILKEDIVKKNYTIRMFFMAIPHLAKHYGNGVVGMVTGKLDENHYAFKKISQNINEIKVHEEQAGTSQETLAIKKNNESLYPPRAVFINKKEDKIENMSFDFLLKKGSRNNSALIAFGEEIDTAVNREGIKIKIRDGKIYFKTQNKKLNYAQRGFNKLLKVYCGICDWDLWFIWQRVSSIQFDEWNNFSINKIKGSYKVFINQHKIGETNQNSCFPSINSLTLQSDGLEIHVHSIKKWQ